MRGARGHLRVRHFEHELLAMPQLITNLLSSLFAQGVPSQVEQTQLGRLALLERRHEHRRPRMWSHTLTCVPKELDMASDPLCAAHWINSSGDT